MDGTTQSAYRAYLIKCRHNHSMNLMYFITVSWALLVINVKMIHCCFYWIKVKYFMYFQERHITFSSKLIQMVIWEFSLLSSWQRMNGMTNEIERLKKAFFPVLKKEVCLAWISWHLKPITGIIINLGNIFFLQWITIKTWYFRIKTPLPKIVQLLSQLFYELTGQILFKK